MSEFLLGASYMRQRHEELQAEAEGRRLNRARPVRFQFVNVARGHARASWGRARARGRRLWSDSPARVES